MEKPKPSVLTLKSTNERIDKIESLIKKDGEKEERLESLKSSLSSLRIFVIAMTLIFLSLFVFILLTRPEVKEVNEEWSLFKTLSFPNWLEIEKNEDTITILVDGKPDNVESINSTYLNPSNSTLPNPANLTYAGTSCPV